MLIQRRSAIILLATKDHIVIREILDKINKRITAFVLRFDSIVTVKPDHKGLMWVFHLFLVVPLVTDMILQTAASYFTLSKWH